MNARVLIVVVLAVVCGLSAVFLVQAIRKPAGAPTIDRTPVVFAVEEVKTGEMVSEKGVEVRQVPTEQVPEDAIRKISDAIDRAAKSTLDKGDMLRELKLADKGAGRGMAALVTPGMRAVAIPTPSFSASLGGFLMSGNRVDINLTTSAGASGGETTQPLLQDVKILAVDKNVNQPASNKVSPEEARFVTVEVTPEDALKLQLGQNRGTLGLTLRNPSDKGRELASIAPPVAPPPPKPPEAPEVRSLASKIKPGMRAFTLDLDKFSATLASHLSAESRVDVLFTATTDEEDKELTGGASTSTLLQDIKILQVEAKEKPNDGKIIQVDVKDKAINQVKPDPGDSRYVTLEITPNQAQILDLGQQVGKLHLSLRSSMEQSEDQEGDRSSNVLVGFDDQVSGRDEVVQERDQPLSLLLAHQLRMVPPRNNKVGSSDPRILANMQVRTLRGTRSGFDTWTLLEPVPPAKSASPATSAPNRDRGRRNVATSK